MSPAVHRDTLDLIFLCFAEKWWDWEANGFAGRTAVLARGLSEHAGVRRTLVVNTPSSVLGRFSGRSQPLIGERLSIEPTCTQVSDKLFVIDQTRLFPDERHHPAGFALNGWLHDAAHMAVIRRMARHLGLRVPAIWLSGPLVAKYMGAIDEPGTIVYDAVDEWLEHPDWRRMRRPITHAYAAIRREADWVFAVTPTLASSFTGGRPRVRVLRNGVDPSLFKRSPGTPRRLSGVAGPVVGYMGAIQQRLDVSLLMRLAEKMTDFQFVLVGPVLDAAHVEPLRSLSNVRFLGPCRGDEVPACLSGFDVCILPHVESPLTNNMDPVKLYEYVASRRPVIASDLPGLEQPDHLVKRAHDVSEWESCIREAVSAPPVSDSLVDAYLHENSWGDRVDSAVEAICGSAHAPYAAVSMSSSATKLRRCV